MAADGARPGLTGVTGGAEEVVKLCAPGARTGLGRQVRGGGLSGEAVLLVEGVPSVKVSFGVDLAPGVLDEEVVVCAYAVPREVGAVCILDVLGATATEGPKESPCGRPELRCVVVIWVEAGGGVPVVVFGGGAVAGGEGRSA